MKTERFEKLIEKWTRLVSKNSKLILLAYIPLVALAGYASVHQLGLNTDISDMISERLEFHARWKAYKKAFPKLSDTVFVVIDSKASGEAREVAKQIKAKAQERADLFESVAYLNGGDFFERNAFLYQDLDTVKTQATQLQDLQPILAHFSSKPNTAGFFESLSFVSQDEVSTEFISQVNEVLEGWKPALVYSKLIDSDSDHSGSQYLELKPILDFNRALPAEASLNWLEDQKQNFGSDVAIGVTGPAALMHEEMKSVNEGAWLSGLVSFVLVSFIFWLALGGFKLIALTILHLAVGLSLTAAFAAMAIGHLNMISVAFAVLFIGLGVDYSLHLSSRYRELLASGLSSSEALLVAMKGIGSSLVLCTLTTAAAFLAFVPTAYAGVAELGLISGVGMFINFFVHMTLFPAFLTVFPETKAQASKKMNFNLPEKISNWAFRHAKGVRISLVVVFVLMLPSLLLVEFDPNPLNLQNPNTQAYKTYRRLLENPENSPWTIKIVKENLEEAKKLAAELEQLPEVSQVISTWSLLPDQQEEKIDSFKHIYLPDVQIDSSSNNRQINQALQQLSQKLSFDLSRPLAEAHATQLRRLKSNVEEKLDYALLEKSLVKPSREFVSALRILIPRQPLMMDDLPVELLSRYRNGQGLYRLEVFPTQDLMDIEAMRSFAKAVSEVSPEATDDPVTLPLTGDAVVDAFLQAAAIATFLVFFILLVLTRSLRDSILVLIPLVFAGVLVKALVTLMGIQFNFANIIVLPLLLGIGVDSGIHILHRFRSNSAGSFENSTQRAVFWSAFTTIASFGTLGLSPHIGTQSMGILLAVGTLVVMLSTLVVLPVLLRASSPEQDKELRLSA